MSLLNRSAALLIGGLLFSVSFSAQADRSDRRQGMQRSRIHQGVKSGEINRAEQKKLNAGQRHIRRVERRSEADGEVTNAESVRIEKAQDRQSRRIKRSKNNESSNEQ
jgi:hypothetical protein